MSSFDIAPEPDAEGLTANLQGLDAQGQPISLPVVQERPLTIYLNRQEIITAMTLGDRPKEMAVGFLFNQNMLKRGDVIIGIDYDDEIDVVVVRTAHKTDYEAKLQKRYAPAAVRRALYSGILWNGLRRYRYPWIPSYPPASS